MLLNREMNYCYSTSELKWSGKHDSHVLYLLVPAGRFGFFGLHEKWCGVLVTLQARGTSFALQANPPL
jgi:hypothetical protein